MSKLGVYNRANHDIIMWDKVDGEIVSYLRGSKEGFLQILVSISLHI